MEYLTKKDTKRNKEEFRIIFDSLKIALGENWTITYSLVGSSKRNMVLVGNGTKGYDLDYQIFLVKYPVGLSEKEIKMSYFKPIIDETIKTKNLNLTPCEDSTHVLTTKKLKPSGAIEYSYDIAIMKNNINENRIIIKNEKDESVNPYHFVQIPNSKDFSSKFKEIKELEKWDQLREVYRIKKEKYEFVQKDKRPVSFSLLKETVNEVLQTK